jgi:hypothetical protein
MLIRIFAKLFGIKRFRKVILHFEDGPPEEHIVNAPDLKKFKEDILQLYYYDPGTGPSTNRESKKLIRITEQPLEKIGHYTYEFLSPDAIWVRPLYRWA